MSAYYGSSNGHYLTGMTSMSAPLTMAWWVKLDSLDVASAIGFQISGGTWVTYWWVFDTGANKWQFGARAGGSDFPLQQSGTATTEWTHLAAVVASPSARKVYVNGVQEGSTTVTVAPTGCTVLSVGFRTDGAIPSSGGAYLAGQAADAAVWTSALGASQVAELAAGASPLIVAPAGLRFYAPLRAGSGVNLRGPALTSYGSPTAGNSHPRLYHP